MRLKLLITVIIITLFTLTVLAGYSEKDLWILEVVVNGDYYNTQVIDALITENEIFLPAGVLGRILNIYLNESANKGVYTFLHPALKIPVVIDTENGVIESGEETLRDIPIPVIKGDIYLGMNVLEKIFDARFEYKPLELVIAVESEHIEKREEDKKPDFFSGSKNNNNEKSQNESKSSFSISNIKYSINNTWERNLMQTESSPDTPELVPDEELERPGYFEDVKECKTQINLQVLGTIFDCNYNLAGSISSHNGGPVDLSLNRVNLSYDFDKGVFKIGDGSVLTENELSLEKTEFYGISLTSNVSPLFRMNGNRIPIRGKAPTESEVILYLNGWKTANQQVGEDGEYYFADVLLLLSDAVNEIKIEIIKPDGEVETIYRYIAVSEAILEKSEVNYLLQTGKLDTDEGQYFLNTTALWGVSDKTTLGLSWYSEITEESLIQKEIFDYSYNSLKLIQRLNDNWILRGTLFSSQHLEQGDSGYTVNLDYKIPGFQGGLEYKKESRLFQVEEEIPERLIKIYFLTDVTPDSFLKARYLNSEEIKDPTNKYQQYEISYALEKEIWKGYLSFLRSFYFSDRSNFKTNLNLSIDYALTPELKLLPEIEYEKGSGIILSEKVAAAVNLQYEPDDNSYFFKVRWDRETTTGDDELSYALNWNRRWNLMDNTYITSGLGFELKDVEGTIWRFIPLNLGFHYIFPDKTTIKFNYQGRLEERGNTEDISHSIVLSLEGAFNFFGGKIVSTSPMFFENNIGIVRGTVFLDSNRNGRLDEGEKPLAKIPVKLDRKVQYTDENGKFIFKQVVEGVHYLGFDYNNLPIEMTPSTADKSVKVVANGEVNEFLGLYIVGAVDGRISVKNTDMEKSLAGIIVTANPGGYTAITDRRGYFYFDQLPPGEYEISVDTTTLPQWLYTGEELTSTIVITEAGDYVGGVDFEVIALNDVDEEEKVEEIKVIEVEGGQKDLDSIVEMLKKGDVLIIDIKNKKALFNQNEIELNPFVLLEEDVLIPLRQVAQMFNYRVYWDFITERIYLVGDELKLLFDTREGYVMVNGEKKDFQNKLIIIKGHSYISLEGLKIIRLTAEIKDDLIYIYVDNS